MSRKNSKSNFLSRNSNIILSMGALFTSSVTLFILMYQTSLASKQFDLEQTQQLASVMPYLEIGPGNADADGFSIIVINSGLGPAFIKKVRVYYKGEVYEDYDLFDFVEVVLSEEDYKTRIYSFSSLSPGNVIPVNEMWEHVVMKYDKTAEAFTDNDVLKNGAVRLEIEFASIYDERWVVKSGGVPEKIKELE